MTVFLTLAYVAEASLNWDFTRMKVSKAAFKLTSVACVVFKLTIVRGTNSSVELARSEVHGPNEKAASGGKKYSLAPERICLETSAVWLDNVKTMLQKAPDWGDFHGRGGGGAFNRQVSRKLNPGRGI
jgi:hypothetical protein